MKYYVRWRPYKKYKGKKYLRGFEGREEGVDQTVGTVPGVL